MTEFPPFRLDTVNQCLWRGEGVAQQRILLTPKAFAVLRYLVEHAGRLVSHDELLDALWPGTHVGTEVLKNHIAAIRAVLGDEARKPLFIETMSRRGYRFIAPVAEDSPATDVSAADRSAMAGPPAGAAPRTNLPEAVSELIGREAELAAVTALASEHRLVSLVGAGGIGKTRLALEVARHLRPRYPDGAFVAELGPLSSPELVPATVASAVGLVHGEHLLSDEGVARAVGAKKLLLVIDNCEHVIDAAAGMAEALLRASPNVTLLATSREPLRVSGEYIYPVPPLEVPAADNQDLEDVFRHGAVRLFVSRARAAEPRYVAEARVAAATAAICRHLDGIPLAIELAATRIVAFGVDGVATRLDDRFRLLTGGRRTLPRHQTMRATLDWSYELLSGPEQMALRRLGVFAGAFTLDAATAVAASVDIPGADVVDAIANLVGKSLLSTDVGGAVVRYRLLETTRAYAREKLGESGESASVLRRHAEHFRDTLECAESEWERRPSSECLAEYGPLIDDVRAALDWACSPSGDPTTGARLAIASAPLWLELSLWVEFHERMARAHSSLAPGALPDPLDLKLVAAFAMATWCERGLRPETEALWVRTLEMAERLDDDEYRIRALWGLYACRNQTGSGHIGLALARRLADIAATRPDTDLPAIADRMIGTSLHFIGDQPAARDHLEQMLARYARTTTRSQRIRFFFDQRVMARITLAHTLWLLGSPDQARRAEALAAADARAAAHLSSLCFALGDAQFGLALYTGDLDAMERAASELLDVATKCASLDWRIASECMRGLVLIKRGDADAHARLVRPALDQLGDGRYFFHYTGFLAALADSLGHAGRVIEARTVVDEAFARCDTTEEHWSMPELLRVKGELLVRENTTADAADHFGRALALARTQKAAGWELRAATSLARLWHAQRRTRQARTLLLPIYRRFTEGLDTADLRSAKALLDRLRP